jgi:hypothetical protein
MIWNVVIVHSDAINHDFIGDVGTKSTIEGKKVGVKVLSALRA